MTTSLPAPATSGTRQPSLGPVGAAVHQRITRLQRGYLDDRSDAVGTLARLRRGIGRPAGETADLWGLIGTEPLYEQYERRELTEDAMRWAEEAAHAAVTLWSLHQQSHHTARMHRRPGPELGAAVRRLAPGAEIDEPTRKRFVRAGTAATPVVLAGRLREIVLLLRREAVPLDYGLLADQLHTWQSPGGPQSVRRSWGRSYLAVPRSASGNGSATAGPNAPGGSDGLQEPDTTTPEDDTP
ncbi:type I-E CRISPR-associated protein Cse2/CasB [Streptomyces pinistramenti]|uniref:type I-E CRISPR-associated protein Cse2/CasB n=1 Tax=Streptomyces pinistramenti TaxID=2884812 RepID=UPI001D0619E1|nr:type I-E CRISPR-associated protein Cse2/CasB [Streptomyces pinistramenti]MCB5908085.1 type I-E CRISPR-associated protein Cse2/CasB [Streptomyces pinistramenti]